MSADDPDDAEVTYTVKELLSGIRDEQSKGFTRIETAMSSKADKADLVRLEHSFNDRFAGHDRELQAQANDIQTLKNAHHTRQAWWRAGKALFSGLASIGVIIGGLGAAGLIHF